VIIEHSGSRSQHPAAFCPLDRAETTHGTLVYLECCNQAIALFDPCRPASMNAMTMLRQIERPLALS
jgi:hypothetical protein